MFLANRDAAAVNETGVEVAPGGAAAFIEDVTKYPVFGGRQILRGTVLYSPRDVRFEERPDPTIVEPTGRHHQDLGGLRMRLGSVALLGHRADHRTEADGPRVLRLVEEVGSAVENIKPGPFGCQSSCMHREGVGGAQAPVLRVPLADGTLVTTPDMPSDDLIPSLLSTSDILGTAGSPPTRPT